MQTTTELPIAPRHSRSAPARQGAAGPAVPAERAGTQSLLRGVALLRALATRGQFGWRLSDLAAACGLDKGTTHRILASLVQERLVQQRAVDRHYLPGPLLYELGLSLQGPAALQRRAEALLLPFARRLGGVALLLLRSGCEYVCSVRAGTVPLNALMVYPGTRRPLFTSVGGVAILQALPADEARAVLVDNIAQEVARRGPARLDALRRMRERSDALGFGANMGDVVPSLHAFAVPVQAGGQAFAAVCIVGDAERYGAERLAEIRAELDAAAQAVRADAQELVFGSAEASARFNM
ncbi:MAG: IclR family transcriptional regulator [Ramlibacter sp.]